MGLAACAPRRENPADPKRGLLSRRPTRPRPKPQELPESAPPTGDRLSIGHVVGRAASLWVGSIVPFTVLSVVVQLPWIVWRVLLLRGAVPAPPPVIEKILSYAVEPALGFVASGLMCYVVLQRMAGRSVGTAQAVGGGGGVLPKALGAGLVTTAYSTALFLAGFALGGLGSAALFLGSVLAVFGLIALCQCWVAVPAAVAERTRPFAAVRRSFALTRGSKWRIFLLVLLPIPLVFVPYVVFGIPLKGGHLTPDALLFELAIDVLVISPLYAAMAAVSYHQLRHAKDGLSSEAIAAVFD